VARHHGCLTEQAEPAPSPDPVPGPDLEQVAADAAPARAEDGALITRTKQRYRQVQALCAEGKGIKAIGRELGLARETVRRFARAGSVDDLLAKPRSGQPSVLDEFIPHLHQRWNAGCTSATQLFNEIRALGYRGSAGTVRGYLRPFRAARTAAPATPRPPKVRHVAGWILRHPDSLDADDRLKLKQARAACPHLDALAGHVTAFAQMMTGRHGDRLDAWIAAVDADDQPDLHSFAAGLKRDHEAVRNGLTLQHSSGAVEGQVNRIKMIKRQMYGRAKFDLLRKRILLGT
jgi:transposase